MMETERALSDAQKLAPQERGLSFELIFYKHLQQVTARIHDTENLDQLMLDSSRDICKLLNADRLTLYAVSEDKNFITSKIKTGLNSAKELILPISSQSIAGFVALTQKFINIDDVYDETALHAIDVRLTFLKEVDRRSGYRTREMMVAPIIEGTQLFGVLQVINNKSAVPFGKLEIDAVKQLCATLATAIKRRLQKPIVVSKSSKYDYLISESVITSDELSSCIKNSREEGISAEYFLMRDLKLKPSQIGHSLSRFFNVPYVSFQNGRIRSDALHGKLKKDFVLSHSWLPLEEGPEGLLVMTLDPETVEISKQVPLIFPQFHRVVYAVTTQTEFEETVAQIYGGAGETGVSIDDMLADMEDIKDDEPVDEKSVVSAAADNDLVKFVNKIIVDAYNQGASDIHIEPMPGKFKTGVRFRIDGALTPYIEVPANFREAMVTRLKIMCDLDISEKRKPQDGKIKFKRFGPLDIELRVATIPSAGGVEDVVMRILAAGEPIPLEKLGLTPHNKTRLEDTISKPYGLFYVCGPTGSGKTTTLHSILKFLNTSETKIWTAEDPVEITQKGLRQVQVNKKAGIDFALIMRAFLRADPDIIMVGESRDQETVRMGIEASLTGHLVFSTLHTNSAPESIIRLLDMGMDPFNFSDALLGILAQRLAKRLCACKESYEPSHEELHAFVREYTQDLVHTQAWKQNPQAAVNALVHDWRTRYGQDGKLKFFKAKGCDHCRGTGYKGRVGLHELLVTNDTIRGLIQERARVSDIFVACVDSGMRSLKMDGMEKILMGLTDLKQVRSVCIK